MGSPPHQETRASVHLDLTLLPGQTGHVPYLYAVAVYGTLVLLRREVMVDTATSPLALVVVPMDGLVLHVLVGALTIPGLCGTLLTDRSLSNRFGVFELSFQVPHLQLFLNTRS
jgi:hypothetical protein